MGQANDANPAISIAALHPIWGDRKGVELATGLSQLERYYQQRPTTRDGFEFMRYTLEALNVHYQVDRGRVEQIPAQGPVVIVANHPLGAIEGVILADLVGQVRKDVKVLANQLLKRLPEIEPLFIGVDVFNGAQASKTNARGIREAHRHLAEGGVLIRIPPVKFRHRKKKPDS